MMSSTDVNVFSSDDVIYHILLRLPVISLLRFKNVCKSWRALVESSDFIKEHLHYHHYDHPILKNENHSLIFCLPTDHPPITFLITSIHNFKASTRYLQLDCPNLQEYFPAHVDVAIFNGIICLHIEKGMSQNKTICLWNPATKQYRFLPQPSFSLTPELEDDFASIMVGFGFDVKTNDYKVVKLIKYHVSEEKRVEVYSLSTDSWRSIDAVFPVDYFYLSHPKMPFHNGTCFCWNGYNSDYQPWICCFDFSFESFRSISFPDTDHSSNVHLSIANDKIAYVPIMNYGYDDEYAEIWVLNDYGSINESWAKLYKIDDLYSKVGRKMESIWLSMDGNYLFFGSRQICRYNVVTKEMIYISALEFQDNLKDCGLPKMNFFLKGNVAEFKESLISVGGGNK